MNSYNELVGGMALVTLYFPGKKWHYIRNRYDYDKLLN